MIVQDDAGRWGRAEADAVLSEALAARGRSGTPTVLGDAGTFVYRVGDVVAKVYSPTATVDRYEHAARAGVGLAAAGVPVVAPLDDGRLFRCPAGSVGFWPFIESRRSPEWRDLGSVLRACHATPASVLDRIDVPRWEPRVATRWATTPYRRRGDGDITLADAIDRAGVALTERATTLTAEPATLIHGDAQLQNVIAGADGPLLIDLDWLAFGPTVVDTAPVVRAHRRGTLSDVAYGEFVQAYRSDPASLSGTDLVVTTIDFEEVMFDLALACRRDATVDWLAEAVGPLLANI